MGVKGEIGRVLKNRSGFTLLELLIVVILVAFLASVAIPRYEAMKEQAARAKARAILESGRVGVTLDFANQLLRDGTYTPPFTGRAGAVMTVADRTFLEKMMQGTPNYPQFGTYDTPAGAGFRWYLVSGGGANPPTLPKITAIMDRTCPANDSVAIPPGANDDCDVSKF